MFKCWNLYQGAVLRTNSTSLAVWSIKNQSINQFRQMKMTSNSFYCQ